MQAIGFRLISMFAAALVAGAGGLYAGHSARFGNFIERHSEPPPRSARAGLLSFANQPNPKQVPCPAGALVLVPIGQSIASNHGSVRAIAPRNVVNFYRGSCYAARDPLLGATGIGGSIWTRLGSKLDNQPVIIAPVAVDSSSVMAWAPGGTLHANLTETLRALVAAGIPATDILWQQGEADLLYPPGEYRDDLTRLLREVRQSTAARVHVALASRCKNEPVAAIRDAQRQAAGNAGALIGPDTDQVGASERFDGCHMDGQGLDHAASLWAEAIKRPLAGYR